MLAHLQQRASCCACAARAGRGRWERPRAVLVTASADVSTQVQIPGSRQESVKQAATAINVALKRVRPGKKSKKKVAAVRQLLDNMAPTPPVVALNPSWNSGNPSKAQKTFIDMFDTVYCFQPLAVQILLSTKEGCVYRCLSQQGPQEPPWQVMMKLDGRYTPVFSKATRPSGTDLEVVFYNTAAATSPMTKGIASARSWLDNLRGAKS